MRNQPFALYHSDSGNELSHGFSTLEEARRIAYSTSERLACGVDICQGSTRIQSIEAPSNTADNSNPDYWGGGRHE